VLDAWRWLLAVEKWNVLKARLAAFGRRRDSLWELLAVKDDVEIQMKALASLQREVGK
jgi:hypothetical protein